MTCQEVVEYMQRFLDQDLGEADTKLLHEHLSRCPECKAMFDRLQHLSGELERLPKVAPAFSLVDAILPRLDEIDRQRESGHAARLVAPNTDSGSAEPTQGRSPSSLWKKRFSYKIGGVVAAGIVLGLMLIQSEPFQSQYADDGAAEITESSESFESSPAEEKAASDDDVALYRAEGAEDAATTDKAGIGNPDEAVSFDAASSDAVSSSEQTDQKGKVMASASADASHDGGGENGSGGGNDSGGQGEAAQSFTGTGEPDEMAPDAEPAAELVPGQMKGIAASTDDPPIDDELHGALGLPEQPGHLSIAKTASPDNTRFAYVDQNRIIITDTENNPLFVTEELKADEIRVLGWSDDGASLTYETVTAETRSTFRIDLTTGSTTEIKP